MGTLIRFPDERRMAWKSAALPLPTGGASVVILPVVRIERHEDVTLSGYAPQADTPGAQQQRPGR